MIFFKNNVFFMINGDRKIFKILFFCLFCFFNFFGSYAMDKISENFCSCEEKNSRNCRLKQILDEERDTEHFKMYCLIRKSGKIGSLKKDVALKNFINIIKWSFFDLSFALNSSEIENDKKEECYFDFLKKLDNYFNFFVENQAEILFYVDKKSLLEKIKEFKNNLDLELDFKAVQEIKKKYNLSLEVGLGDIVILKSSNLKKDTIKVLRFFIEKCCCFSDVNLDQDLVKIELYNLKEKYCKEIDEMIVKLSEIED